MVVLCILIGGGITFHHARSLPRAYSATAQLLFGANATVLNILGVPISSGGANSGTAEATNTAIAGLPIISDDTARALGSKLPPGGVDVSVEPLGSSNFVAITATSKTPAGAALVANEYSTQFIAYSEQQQEQQVQKAITEIRREIATLGGKSATSQVGNLQTALEQLEGISATNPLDVSVAQYASPPSEPNSRKTGTKVAEGVLLGLVVGLIAALLLEWTDPRLRSLSQLSSRDFVRISSKRLLIPAGSRLENALAIRLLRAAAAGDRTAPARVLVLSSAASPADVGAARRLGRALAAVSARPDARVAIVDLGPELDAPVVGQEAESQGAGEPAEARSARGLEVVLVDDGSGGRRETVSLSRQPLDFYADVVRLPDHVLVSDADVEQVLGTLADDYRLVIVVAPDPDENSPAAAFISAADAAAFVVVIGRSSRRHAQAGLSAVSSTRSSRLFVVEFPAGWRTRLGAQRKAQAVN